MEAQRYQSFKEFYPYYLSEHSKTGTKVTHFIGTSLFFVALALTIYLQNPWLIISVVVTPYLFAWIGHFFIEKNKPATFKYPLWSLAGDFKMYFQLISGKVKF